jgi:hypothetical protein
MKIVLLIITLIVLLVSCANVEQIEEEDFDQEENQIIESGDLIMVQNTNLNRNLYSFELVNTQEQDIECSIEILIKEGDKTQIIEENIGLIKPGEIKKYQNNLNLPQGTSKISLETYCNLI